MNNFIESLNQLEINIEQWIYIIKLFYKVLTEYNNRHAALSKVPNPFTLATLENVLIIF